MLGSSLVKLHSCQQVTCVLSVSCALIPKLRVCVMFSVRESYQKELISVSFVICRLHVSRYRDVRKMQ